MKRFLNSDLFIFIWGAALLIYWPVGVALSVLGLVGSWYEGKKVCFHKIAEQH